MSVHMSVHLLTVYQLGNLPINLGIRSCVHNILQKQVQTEVHDTYGVASVSRIDEILGLFCKRALYKRQYPAKETFNFIDPTDRSHLIC